MAANFRAGDAVRLVQPVIEGKVVRVAITGDGNLGYLTRWTDASGEIHERVFDERELEAAPAPAVDAGRPDAPASDAQ
jgi:hypothetical protein